MSGFYSFAYSDRVQILTDGAGCDDAGIYRYRTDKVARSSRLPVAMAARGRFSACYEVVHALLALDDADSVDEFLERAATCVETLSTTDLFVEMLIACVSETLGPAHFFFATHSLYSEIPPYA